MLVLQKCSPRLVLTSTNILTFNHTDDVKMNQILSTLSNSKARKVYSLAHESCCGNFINKVTDRKSECNESFFLSYFCMSCCSQVNKTDLKFIRSLYKHILLLNSDMHLVHLNTIRDLSSLFWANEYSNKVRHVGVPKQCIIFCAVSSLLISN